MSTAVETKRLPLSAAALLFPVQENGRPPAATTVGRWIKDGLKGPDGKIVRLGGQKFGSKWYTTAEWIEEFGRAMTPSFQADDKPAS